MERACKPWPIPWFVAAALVSIPIVRACEYSYPIWGIRSKSADPLFRFVRHGKAGYIDSSGKIVIRPTLPADSNLGGEFHEGLLPVEQDPGYGFMDRSGKVVLQADVWLALDFSEGLAPAPLSQLKRQPKWGFIDRSGRFAIPPQYLEVEAFSEGLARVTVSNEAGNTGYIDGKGKFVVPPLLSYGSSFHEGRAAVIMDGPCAASSGSCGRAEFRPTKQPAAYDCRFAFIDKRSQPVSGLRFDDTKDFAEGLAPVRLGQAWGYVDRSGQISIAPRFESAEPFSEGLAAVGQNGKTGFIDHSGSFVIPPQFEYADGFSDGRALVSKSNGDGTAANR